jgi:hypothetical protein
MQHHDAKNNFVVMGTPIDEIPESDRVVVLVENADAAAQFKLSQTITAITADRTKLTDELSLSKASANPPSGFLGKAAIMQTQYDLLKAIVSIAETQLTGTQIPPRFSKDETPTFVTKVVPHDVPGPAPAKVDYSIKKVEGTTETEVAKQSYRVNRLYRVRFRTGLMYSTLRTTEVKDGKENTSQYGVDAVFGIQTYFVRRDIRHLNHNTFSLFTGLTVRDATHNLLVGPGWEPVSGVTLTAGIHVGRSQKLKGTETVEQWRGRPFFALTFDVDLFKQLLGIKPTL